MPNPTPHEFTDKYEFNADFPGETLSYLEAGRRADMIWTWTNGYTVYSDSLTSWQNPDGSRTPVTEGERKIILERAVKYAADVQHVKMKVE